MQSKKRTCHAGRPSIKAQAMAQWRPDLGGLAHDCAIGLARPDCGREGSNAGRDAGIAELCICGRAGHFVSSMLLDLI